MDSLPHGVALLPQLGVIAVTGEDAAKFLQGQLTQDFSLLGLSEARLAAYCSAKGRMLASFVGFKRSHDEFLLVCDQGILAPTLKRLSMFVLRAKVRLSDASSTYAVYGLVGAPLDALAPGIAIPWSREQIDNASLVALYPADGQHRALYVGLAGNSPPAGVPMTAAHWDWTEVRSGIARISQPIVEAFVPQMLNYESVGGVNFKKGCYPGQEVVARSQFRGTLKRRAYIAHSSAELKAGQEVFQAADPHQPCGLVAQAAESPTGGTDAIVSLQIAAAQLGGLRVASVEGAEVALQPLPYFLLADV